MIKITLDNHEGYYKLYKLRSLSIDEKDIKNNIDKLIIIGTIEVLNLLLISSFNILNLPFLATTITLGFFASPFIYACKVYKQKRDKIAKEYPNVDIDVKTEELKEALKKAHILKYEKQNDINNYTLDKDGYLKFLKEEKIRKEYINKCDNIKNEVIKNYNIIQDDFIVDDEQLEIAKQKIKILTK